MYNSIHTLLVLTPYCSNKNRGQKSRWCSIRGNYGVIFYDFPFSNIRIKFSLLNKFYKIVTVLEYFQHMQNKHTTPIRIFIITSYYLNAVFVVLFLKSFLNILERILIANILWDGGASRSYLVWNSWYVVVVRTIQLLSRYLNISRRSTNFSQTMAFFRVRYVTNQT